MKEILEKAASYRRSSPAKAIRELNKIKPDQVKDIEILKQIYRLYVDNYQSLGDMNKLEKYLFKLKPLIDKDEKLTAYYHKMKGIVLVEKGEYSSGLENLKKVLDFAYKINDQQAIFRETANLGVLLCHLEKFDRAMECFNQALAIAQSRDYPQEDLLMNMATIYIDKPDKLDKALNLTTKALKIYREKGNNVAIAGCFINLGIISSKENNFQQAVEYLFKARELSQELKMKSRIAETEINLGINLHKLNRNEEALTFLHSAYDYALEYDKISHQEQIKRELAGLYNSMGRLQEAYDTLMEADELKEKILDNKTREDIAKYDIRLEMENKLNEKEHLLMLYARQAEMGQMIAAIAHQWRQPLNALSIILDSIYDAWQFDVLNSDTLHTKVASGKELIYSMNKTIDDFRSFFRVEQQQDIFNVREVLEKAMRFTDYRFRQKNIKLEYSIRDDCLLEGSSNQLLQVILIILNNAFDAFQEVELQAPFVSIWQRVENDNSKIIIADNAGGIPEKDLTRIFESNFTTKDHSEGTGIGLYLARMIIELKFKGTIAVSNKDNGAVFTLELPVFKRNIPE